MLERTTRTYLDDILSKDFSTLQDNNLIDLENKRSLRLRLKNNEALSKEDGLCNNSNSDNIMTRKTRTRRPRITVIQSGYCAVCNLPYNNVEDHIQSKKHLKLIGEDANYIALNGSLNGFLQTNNIPFLNLNGIDAIGVHDNSLDEFSAKYRRQTMPKTRASSIACERVKPSPLSPTGSDIVGHHQLRSRRNINYMTPPLDDDSLQDTLDISLPEEPTHTVFKEYRELRSSTRALAKLTEQIPDPQEDVWSSGRPKRSCIRAKRLSLDDNSGSNCKTYYKVEVVTGKTKSNSTDQEKSKRLRSQSPKQEDGRKDTGLIVKFKKLRNSELVQLNNEATNFLFPKRDESDKEDDGESATDDIKCVAKDVDKANEKICNTDPANDLEHYAKKGQKIKQEDETSADSTSSHKAKKKRRTQAEAFILDNQKYYKFETPGSSSSRLRYQGSYLQPIVKPSKNNGDVSPKSEEAELEDFVEEKVELTARDLRMNDLNFCFEKVPSNAAWYKTFQRVDRGEQRYRFVNERLWNPYVLPYQMPKIAPLDPKVCIDEYMQLLKMLREPISEENSTCTSPEPCGSGLSPPYDPEMPEMDEDSKMSGLTTASACSSEETGKRKGMCGKELQPVCSGKNPRKSPRQHASTLAILSSLLYQRKRRSKNKPLDESSSGLPTIFEENAHVNSSCSEQENSSQALSPKEEDSTQLTHEFQEEEKQSPVVVAETEQSVVKTKLNVKSKYHWRFKPKLHYRIVAQNIDDELNSAFDDFDKYALEVRSDSVDFHNCRTNTTEILRLFEEGKAKETDKSCRRFFNGTPGRKPGRKRKKNLTGWPNKNKRIPKRENSKEKYEVLDKNSTADSNRRKLVKRKQTEVVRKSKGSDRKDDKNADCCDIGRVNKNNKTLRRKEKSELLQPYVYVQKLDNKIFENRICTPQRTVKKQKRVPGSPRSPRSLRKPRGRRYKER